MLRRSRCWLIVICSLVIYIPRQLRSRYWLLRPCHLHAEAAKVSLSTLLPCHLHAEVATVSLLTFASLSFTCRGSHGLVIDFCFPVIYLPRQPRSRYWLVVPSFTCRGSHGLVIDLLFPRHLDAEAAMVSLWLVVPSSFTCRGSHGLVIDLLFPRHLHAGRINWRMSATPCR